MSDRMTQLALFDAPAALPADIQARIAALGLQTVWRDHDNDAIGGWVVSWPHESPDDLIGFSPAYEPVLREWLDEQEETP